MQGEREEAALAVGGETITGSQSVYDNPTVRPTETESQKEQEMIAK